MKEVKRISVKGILWFVSITIFVVEPAYLYPLLSYAWRSQFFWQIAIFSFVSILFMTNWRVAVGEEGHILCFGFDTGWRCGPGHYPMPSLIPVLRITDFTFGFSVEVPSREHEGSTTNIRHFFDQRSPTYRVNVQAGIIHAFISQIFSNLLLWIFDMRSADGKFKYYKFGGLCYMVAWLIAASTINGN